jgi:hypothetical protein
MRKISTDYARIWKGYDVVGEIDWVTDEEYTSSRTSCEKGICDLTIWQVNRSFYRWSYCRMLGPNIDAGVALSLEEAEASCEASFQRFCRIVHRALHTKSYPGPEGRGWYQEDSMYVFLERYGSGFVWLEEDGEIWCGVFTHFDRYWQASSFEEAQRGVEALVRAALVVSDWNDTLRRRV